MCEHRYDFRRSMDVDRHSHNKPGGGGECRDDLTTHRDNTPSNQLLGGAVLSLRARDRNDGVRASLPRSQPYMHNKFVALADSQIVGQAVRWRDEGGWYYDLDVPAGSRHRAGRGRRIRGYDLRALGRRRRSDRRDDKPSTDDAQRTETPPKKTALSLHRHSIDRCESNAWWCQSLIDRRRVELSEKERQAGSQRVSSR